MSVLWIEVENKEIRKNGKTKKLKQKLTFPFKLLRSRRRPKSNYKIVNIGNLKSFLSSAGLCTSERFVVKKILP